MRNNRYGAGGGEGHLNNIYGGDLWQGGFMAGDLWMGD